MFRNGRVWFMSLIYFAFVTGQYGLTFWMPTIVKASGVQGNLNIGLISAIPFLCAAVVMVLLGLSADRMRERRWHLIVPALSAPSASWSRRPPARPRSRWRRSRWRRPAC